MHCLWNSREKLLQTGCLWEIKIYYRDSITVRWSISTDNKSGWIAHLNFQKLHTVCGVEYVPHSGISSIVCLCQEDTRGKSASKRREQGANRQACIELFCTNDEQKTDCGCYNPPTPVATTLERTSFSFNFRQRPPPCNARIWHLLHQLFVRGYQASVIFRTKDFPSAVVIALIHQRV